VFNHEPEGYSCPFCRLVRGEEDAGGVNREADVVRRSGLATAFIAPRWWPNNHGHVLVVPDAHHENLYDLPSESGHAVHDLVREVAIAIRETYGCAGTSVRQHNEPAGHQTVWHYHAHVYPRYPDDALYSSRPYPEYVSAEARLPFAERLRGYFATTGA
jgi:histidine triad (HIT) family protein